MLQDFWSSLYQQYMSKSRSVLHINDFCVVIKINEEQNTLPQQVALLQWNSQVQQERPVQLASNNMGCSQRNARKALGGCFVFFVLFLTLF